MSYLSRSLMGISPPNGRPTPEKARILYFWGGICKALKVPETARWRRFGRPVYGPLPVRKTALARRPRYSAGDLTMALLSCAVCGQWLRLPAFDERRSWEAN